MDEKIICLAQSDVENKLPLADPVWIRSLFSKDGSARIKILLIITVNPLGFAVIRADREQM